MSEDKATTAVAVEVKPKTQAQLLAEMKAATDAGNWKAVSKISSEIAKMVTAQEKFELDKKQAAVAKLTIDVKAKVDKFIQSMIDTKELDNCDGVWFSYDFGDKASSMRLTKTATRAKGTGGTGGGGGKKFAISTGELLTKHGASVWKDGQTYQQVYDSNTSGNSRYVVRCALLKLEGLV